MTNKPNNKVEETKIKVRIEENDDGSKNYLLHYCTHEKQEDRDNLIKVLDNYIN